MSFFVLLFTAIIQVKQLWFHYLSSFLTTTFQGYEVMTLCKLSKSWGKKAFSLLLAHWFENYHMLLVLCAAAGVFIYTGHCL